MAKYTKTVMPKYARKKNNAKRNTKPFFIKIHKF